MKIYTQEIEIDTRGNTDIIDVTGKVEEIIKEAEVTVGICLIFTPSSTSGVTTIEYEPGCLQDLKRVFERIAPSGEHYAHNARWGDGNGHSHIRAALLGASVTIPVQNHQLMLGTWQQIILVDFDIRPRRRRLKVQVLGE
ncbi:secondary thiamine-phosphate synthase enzyme [Bellilinea caldifistulae]|uniref:Secondary thiamine-phosphate synthase enzyme n=1 Tax=Bellilinea caldifistulae TaxID=360411 RepID=A0A0P6WZX1_9CHLR|nr:secondary thiamine-phosphate synthase enzyme YjbQ [Bellilinea caldifistulae]KPL72433.1 secondary thiamine-phosphate synthase enzyme [Bellilinea caldifistulae]GAP10870.1 secondary thiamine-phosphate synthase enzyme [Bellilinea caldifistulae]